MSDAPKKEPEKKDDPKKGDAKDHGVMVTQSFVDWMVHRLMENVLPFGAKWVSDQIAGKTRNAVEERPKQIISFGEAFIKLHEVDLYSYDVINDFMSVALIKDADRNDFQVRTAKLGGDNADVTVAFLQLLANEPDHQARMQFLDKMGIIGERAIDPFERAQLIAKAAWNLATKGGGEAVAWLQRDLGEGSNVLRQELNQETDRLEQELQNRRTARAARNTNNSWFGRRRR